MAVFLCRQRIYIFKLILAASYSKRSRWKIRWLPGNSFEASVLCCVNEKFPSTTMNRSQIDEICPFFYPEFFRFLLRNEAAHNYDGDMLTDEVAQVHRSSGLFINWFMKHSSWEVNGFQNYSIAADPPRPAAACCYAWSFALRHCKPKHVQ